MTRRNGAGVIDGLCGSVGAGQALTVWNCSSVICDDAVTTSNVDRVRYTNRLLAMITAARTSTDLIDISAVAADGYTPNIGGSFAADATFALMALGGSDITNVAAGNFSISSGTGNASITGLAFQPDIVIFVGGSAAAAATVTAGMRLGFGVAKSSSEQWAVAMSSADADATGSNSSGIVTTSQCTVVLNDADGTVQQRLSFVSMNADGFTVNRGLNSSTNVGYLAIKGGRYAVGTTAMRTDTNTTAVTGLGIGTPVGLVLAMRGGVTASEGTTSSAHAEIGFGFTDGTTNLSMWLAEEDAQATTDSYSSLSTTRVIHDLDKETGASDEGDMTLASFDSDGFTLDQDTAAGSATLIPFLAIGQAAGGGGLAIPVAMNIYRQMRG